MVPVSLKKFKVKVTKAAECPFAQLHHFVANELGGVPAGKLIDITKVGLGPTDYARLEKLTKQWIKKQKPYFNAKLVNEAYSWVNLDIGPRNLESVEKDGFAYVEAPLFRDKESA